MSRTVLVLGANGFVGRHVVAGLAETDDLRPVAGVRRAAAAGAVETRMVDAVKADSVAAALDGVTDVVNCVAAAPDAMVQATRVVSAAAGPRRIVHLSSMAVYGGATGVVDEDAPLAPEGDYGTSKAASEGILREAGGDAVILRPGCIHGPGSEQWTGRPARLLRMGRLGDLGPAGDGVCNLTSVQDMVAAVIAGLRAPGAGGQAFNVSGPAPEGWDGYFLRLAKAIGATPVRRLTGRRMKIEKLASIPLKVAEIAAGKLGVRTPDPLPPSLLRLFRQDITLDHRRADAVLGFPRMPPERALAAAAEWFLRRA